MKEKTLPVGSVVKMKEYMALIVGVVIKETENNDLVKMYKIVPYPSGYNDGSSVRLIEASKVQAVFEGYQSEFAEPYLKYVSRIEAAVKEFGASAVKEGLKELQEEMEEI